MQHVRQQNHEKFTTVLFDLMQVVSKTELAKRHANFCEIYHPTSETLEGLVPEWNQMLWRNLSQDQSLGYTNDNGHE